MRNQKYTRGLRDIQACNTVFFVTTIVMNVLSKITFDFEILTFKFESTSYQILEQVSYLVWISSLLEAGHVLRIFKTSKLLEISRGIMYKYLCIIFIRILKFQYMFLVRDLCAKMNENKVYIISQSYAYIVFNYEHWDYFFVLQIKYTVGTKPTSKMHISYKICFFTIYNAKNVKFWYHNINSNE